MTKLYKDKLFRYIFLIPFFTTFFYILVVQTELYRSTSSILIKDLSAKQDIGMDLGIFSSGVGSQGQDAAIMEEYLRSYEVYERLDSIYGLSSYYTSDAIDMLDRVIFETNMMVFLQKYNKNLYIKFDELSGIINIGFYHADATKALDISKKLLEVAEEKLNQLNKINSEKILLNIISSVDKNKIELDNSIKMLEDYQNRYNIIDPQIQIEQNNAIISSLKTSLIEKQVRYSSLKNYSGKYNIEVKQLSDEIDILKDTINKKKRELSGDEDDTINKKYFEFEKLKSQVDFDKEVYKQSLVQYELMKTQTTQNSKTLEVIVEPKLSDNYSQPDKFKSIITFFILYLVAFGIVSLLKLVVKDHQD